MEQNQPLPISRIPDVVEEITGRKPSLDTVRRWIRDGYRGVKLRFSGTIQFRYTTRKWIAEFLERCGTATGAEADESDSVIASTEASRAAAEALERRFGIKQKAKR